MGEHEDRYRYYLGTSVPAMPCQDPWLSATADRLPPSPPAPQPVALEGTGLLRSLE